MRRASRGGASVALVVLALQAQACLAGRDLYFAPDDPAADQDVNATSASDGGASRDGRAGDARADGVSPSDDASDVTDAPTPDGHAPDSGRDAGVPTCAGGTAVEHEPNDTVDLANPLTIGTTCGALTLGDTDWFTMDLGNGGQLVVVFQADGDARLLLQSAAGGLALATGSGGAFNFATQGVWNLRVVSDTGRPQSYSLVRK
jgi:hypothetical protein